MGTIAIKEALYNRNNSAVNCFYGGRNSTVNFFRFLMCVAVRLVDKALYLLTVERHAAVELLNVALDECVPTAIHGARSLRREHAVGDWDARRSRTLNHLRLSVGAL